MNLYRYAANNPIDFIDPLGLHDWPYSHSHATQPHPTEKADAMTQPKLFGLLGYHTIFYPHYETRHPYEQEMIDKHEQYHHEVDLTDEIGAYMQELKNIEEKLKGLDPNDPGVKKLKDLQKEIKNRIGCPK